MISNCCDCIYWNDRAYIGCNPCGKDHKNFKARLAPPLSIEYTKESVLDSQVSSPLLTQVGGSHYKDKAIQPIEYCYKNKLGPCETLAIRYISRHKTKNGKIDIEKAIHSLQLLLELEYKI